MRKLAVFNQVSLDGYFVDIHGDMTWAHKGDAEWQAFIEENARGGGELLFGRITYELMASHWPTPHALEIPFVFDTLGNGTELLWGSDPPRRLADIMHAAWVSFAAHGDPGWPRYDLSRRATMRFDTTSELVDDRSALRGAGAVGGCALASGHLAYESMDFAGNTLSMLAFCDGGILFYTLLYKSGLVPRALSLWGLVAVVPCLVETLAQMYGPTIPFAFYVPYVPFELVIAIWILVKGVPEAAQG